jgi:oligo-1,6-glucosidase
MIALRATTPAFVYGDYKDLDPQHPHIFVYTRTLGPDRYLVIHNFSAQPIAYTLPDSSTAGALIMDNYRGDEANTNTLHLKGWESRIYKQ